VADDLMKALLLEEVVTSRQVADALFTSVNGRMPIVQTLIETGVTAPDVLARYLARSEAPFLRQIVPLADVLARLPPGLCTRLCAIPVRHDAITGTIDVVVADATDLHPANEIGFHLGAPVRLVRATPGAIDEALRKMKNEAQRNAQLMVEPPLPLVPGFTAPEEDDERLYDSRPRAYPSQRPPIRIATMPPAAPVVPIVALHSAAPKPRPSLMIQPDTEAPPPPGPPVRIRTPPWGTPIHAEKTEPPPSGYGSEIPLPLTRKTFYPTKSKELRGGTQRPPAIMVDPSASMLGEGYSFDATNLRDVVERTHEPRIDFGPAVVALPSQQPMSSLNPPLGSFIPGPPPVPQVMTGPPPATPHYGIAEMAGIVAALKQAGSRDEVLELVLTGSRLVATKVALFVVKKGGYLGWMCTPELADRSALQSVLVPLEDNSVFDRAIREDVYLGPIRYDDIHAPLLRILRNPTRDVAVVPIRVSGRTAVIIMADELGDTMIGTRRLEELARAAGESFARIVRTRR
jgi:hypothetical protein